MNTFLSVWNTAANTVASTVGAPNPSNSTYSTQVRNQLADSYESLRISAISKATSILLGVTDEATQMPMDLSSIAEISADLDAIDKLSVSLQTAISTFRQSGLVKDEELIRMITKADAAAVGNLASSSARASNRMSSQ